MVSTKGCITRDRGVGAAGNAKVFGGALEGRKVGKFGKFIQIFPVLFFVG